MADPISLDALFGAGGGAAIVWGLAKYQAGQIIKRLDEQEKAIQGNKDKLMDLALTIAQDPRFSALESRMENRLDKYMEEIKKQLSDIYNMLNQRHNPPH